MQRTKRMRVFAGPNGLGKSTLFEQIKQYYYTGYFINADEIEKQLSTLKLIDLALLGLKVSESDLLQFKQTPAARSLLAKAQDEENRVDIEGIENFIVNKTGETHSYEGSFVASFIRHLLLTNQRSFSFETVMSHKSKIDEIKEAKNLGYRIYLYFVCTDDPFININRIENRVEKGGHRVITEKIVSRYPKSLRNLYPAIQLADRVYLFDNSKKKQALIAEIYKGSLKLHVSDLPDWFMKYVLPHFV